MLFVFSISSQIVTNRKIVINQQKKLDIDMKTKYENKIKKVNVTISNNFDHEVLMVKSNTVSTLRNLRITRR